MSPAARPRPRLPGPASRRPRTAPAGPPPASVVGPAEAGGSGAPPTASTGGRRRRRRWPTIVGSTVLGLLLVAAVAAAFIHLPYRIISPGEATPLDERVVSVSGAPTYRHSGNFLYLTVRITPSDPNVYRWLFSQFDDDVTIEGREDFQGCATDAENLRLGTLEMTQSQDTAKAVALRRLGYTVTDEASRIVIVDVVCNGPSAGILQLGDEIKAIDGHPITDVEQVRPLIVAHEPGDRISVTVDRGGETLDLAVRAGRRDGVAYLGIRSGPIVTHHFPVDVNIDTERVSGPSAGLAFTLAIIDELTPGSLTGGRPVAVTGTIGPDGEVGPVGGVRQKAVAASDSGAKLMLVPPDEVKEARAHAGGMKVVSVKTLDEALAALQRNGGEPVTSTTTTTGPIAGQSNTSK